MTNVKSIKTPQQLRNGALLGACGFLLIACSSGSKPTEGQIANPVDLLKKIPACQLAPTSTENQPLGNVRSASCVIPDRDGDTSDGNQVEAYTYSDKQARDQNVQVQGGTSSDGTKLIAGDKFLIVVIGTTSTTGGGAVFYVAPDAIASDVNGSLL